MRNVRGITLCEKIAHAENWPLFPENPGSYLSIKVLPFQREAYGGKDAVVVIVKGTRTHEIMAVIEQISEEKLWGYGRLVLT